MNILMSGQIYIKREPTLIELSPEDMAALGEFYDEELGDTNDDLYVIKDYTGCTSFWVSVIKDDGITMVESVPAGNSKMVDFICDDGHIDLTESPISVTGSVIQFATAAEMDEVFVPLIDFLAEAKYIGRKFRMNSMHPMFDILNKGNDRTALYATNNILLLENYNEQVGHLFEIMRADSKKDIDCSLHEVDTTLDDTYKNKALVYKKVFDYILKNKRKRL